MDTTKKKTGRPAGTTPYHELLKKHGLKESQLAEWADYKNHGTLLSSSGRDKFRAYTQRLIEAIEASIRTKL